MDRTTVSLRERHTEQIDAEKDAADDDDLGTSEAVRRIFDRAAEVDELRNERDELDNRVADLERQLMASNQRIDATNELVRHVEEERTYAARRAEASLPTKLKWSLFGMPSGEKEGQNAR